MKKVVLCLLVVLSHGLVAQKKLNQLLDKLNSGTIPYIYQDSLANHFEDFILLDAREFNEYEVSHLKNSIFVGYHNFSLSKILSKIPNQKEAKLVVYCSLGVRSEDIAEKLKAKGYQNVYNLYGGIFQWKNKGNKVFCHEKETEKIHVFDKEWGKWLIKGEKVYE